MASLGGAIVFMPTAAYNTLLEEVCPVAAEVSHDHFCNNQSSQAGALRETGSNLGLPYYNTL